MVGPGSESAPAVLYGLMIGLPLLVVGVSIPLVRGSIGPNRWYGVRTRKTLGSPEIWYRANRLGGIYLIVATVVAVGTWPLLDQVPVEPALRMGLCLGVLAAGQMIATALLLLRIGRM